MPSLNRFLTVVGVVAALCACTTSGPRGPFTVPVQVATYNQSGVAGSFVGHKVAVVPVGDQAQSLEFRHAAELLGRQLNGVGATIVENRNRADLLVTMTASISEPQTTVASEVRRVPMYADPWYPRMWLGSGWGRRSGGFLGYGTGFGYGARPYYRETVAQTTYHANLKLSVYDAKKVGKRPIESILPDGQVIASVVHTRPQLMETMPTLLRAAVQAYPGTDGTIATVNIGPIESAP